MFRAMLVGFLGIVFFGASLALAQEPPPLEPPASEPDPPKASASRPPQPAASPPVSPAHPASVGAPASAASQVRPMLVIPGVTAPAQPSGAVTKSGIPRPSPRAGSPVATPRTGAPSAAGPSDLSSPVRPATGAAVRRGPEQTPRHSIPLTLEPLDDEPPPDQRTRTTTSSRSAPEGPKTVTSSVAGRAPTSTAPSESQGAPAGPRSAPSRMPGLLGRFFQPPAAPPRRDESRSSASNSRNKDDSRPEPVTDALVKRKIERQIRDTLGDRVRSIEVRVSGRNVLIVAKASRFWQKRTVRRALETLPALAGYRARIELDD